MSEIEYGQFAGILLRRAWEEGAGQDIRQLGDNVRLIGKSGAWRHCEFTSPNSLLGEEGIGPFHYQFYALLGKGLAVVVAFGRPVIEHLVSEKFERTTGFREVIVNVDGLADDVTQGIPYTYEVEEKGSFPPEKKIETIRYILSSVHAKTPGLAEQIRSLSIYGDNIAAHALYKDNRKFFNLTSCGLRHGSLKEIAQIKADGTLSFHVHTRWLPHRLLEIMHLMGYVVARNRLLDAIDSQD